MFWWSLTWKGLLNGAVSQFGGSVMSDSLQPHGLQHTRVPTPGAYANSCPLSRCHPAISSSVVPFSSRLQSSLVSGSFPVSWFFASGGQIIGVSASASVLPMNIQDWFPYSCLENPMDGGAWWAAVHGVAKSRTRLTERLSLILWQKGRGHQSWVVSLRSQH